MKHPLVGRQTNDGIEQTVEAYSPQNVYHWKKTGQPKEWERIITSSDSVTEDTTISWSPAIVQKLTEVKRTFIQSWMKTEIEGTIMGPNNIELLQASKDARSNFLVWMNEANLSIDDEIERRWKGREGVEKLGTSFALLRGITPMKEVVSLAEYYPGENVVTDGEARDTYNDGINYVLGQVTGFRKEGEHMGCDFIRELREFRKNRVRWAGLQGDSIHALESATMGDAWMIAVPHDHRLMENPNTLRVERFSAGHVLYIKPYAMTREWAGILGAHELQHLHDFVTGTEPPNPNRAQYIEGEVRAYSTELTAADIFSQGKFTPALDEVLRHIPGGQEQIIGLQDNTDMLVAISRNLDASITSQAPLSSAEGSMRAAFYMFALAFRHAEQQAKDPSEHLDAMRKVVETIYGRIGALPKE